MNQKFRAIIARPFARYLIIGVSVYLFELVVIFVAQHLGATALVAVALSYWLGFLVSFGLQKFITFGDTRMHHRVIVSQLIATALLIGFNFIFTLFVTRSLTGIVSPMVSRTLALGMTTVWNFYLYRTRIFKAPSNQKILID